MLAIAGYGFEFLIEIFGYRYVFPRRIGRKDIENILEKVLKPAGFFERLTFLDIMQYLVQYGLKTPDLVENNIYVAIFGMIVLHLFLRAAL